MTTTETADPLLRELVRDEALTRGLDDDDAKRIVEWVSDWAELLVEAARTPEEAAALVKRLSRRTKAIVRFITLWCDPRTRACAIQLAAVERLTCPLPTGDRRKGDLLEELLAWENRET